MIAAVAAIEPTPLDPSEDHAEWPIRCESCREADATHRVTVRLEGTRRSDPTHYLCGGCLGEVEG